MSQESDLTPMLRQYREIKAQHPDAILLYRIGDFYEMFFDDAVRAAKILDIVLTSRNKNDEHPVPLCGVPYHSVQPYLTKLINAGCKVAICDQVEDPRQAKGVVRREVSRVITPGLTLDSASPRQSVYLASIYPKKERYGFALVELSTGGFQTAELTLEEVREELLAREVREVLVPEQAPDEAAQWEGQLLTRLPSWVFEEPYARRMLLEQFQVSTLSGFGCEGIPLGIAAAGAALHYIRQTQKVERLPHITTLKRYERGANLLISDETRKSLDLESLVVLMDRTETAMGGRRLRDWIAHPLTDRIEIEARLDTVQELGERVEPAAAILENLKEVYDLERIAGRLSLGTVNARDLVSLAHSLQALERIHKPMEQLASPRIRTLLSQWDTLPGIVNSILGTLVPEPPFSIREGGLIAGGVAPELDEIREISRSSRDYLTGLEERERQRTGIHSLKVRYNKVFGYYLEVTSTHLPKVPNDYIRKQTLTNAERFITPELKEFEGKILGAEEKIRALEYELFCALRTEVAAAIPRLQALAGLVAELDVLLSSARIAAELRWVRPQIVEDGILQIQGGRHPLVEAHLPRGQFVANDLTLDTGQNRLLLITGPNMAGKSTFIRQAGVGVILAQIGSFVPAQQATVGIVDKLFSRIGASDRLMSGESTFMVEMTETAAILHHATHRSLILLDEIGRGTSTFDGISIAWAVAEYLHDTVGARTLFATHYHELIDLALTRPGIQNYNVAVQEEGAGVVFLYKVVPGGMSHSYGIHVAGLAGLPKPVLSRAKEVLENLEQGELSAEGKPRLAKKRKPNENQITLL